ncbi:MAG: hypothetical protein HZB33_09295 [Nitrospirae bacterium]|nr:hypothetical protein [Nitrospirota bacterium]
MRAEVVMEIVLRKKSKRMKGVRNKGQKSTPGDKLTAFKGIGGFVIYPGIEVVIIEYGIGG